MRRLVHVVALLVVSMGLRLGAQTGLRFAQMTDFHLFDAGYSCFGQDVATERKKNLEAIQWAIERINQENRAKPFDFVAITGDFGLVNLILPGKYSPSRERPTRDACSGTTAGTSDFGPVPSVPVAEAARVLAGLLQKLDVKYLYLVPGNNDVPYNTDLKIEDPEDRELYKAFVSALSAFMAGRVRDLTGEADASWDAPPTTLHGYSLVGMDTASFKPTEDELKAAKPSSPPVESDASRWPACPAGYPHGTVAEHRWKELEKVASATAKTKGPFLLFTHVPDVQDPYEGRQVNKANHCKLPSSWFLDYQAQGVWEDIEMNPNLVAVFAGHFHDPSGAHYGRASASASVPSPVETYIAPPLAIKNQWKQEPSRGFLIVTVAGREVSTQVEWYTPGARPSPKPKPDFREILRRNYGWLLAYFLVAACVFALDVWLYLRRRDKLRRQFTIA